MGSKERCLQTSSFDAKKHGVKQAFDCHIPTPIKQQENSLLKGVTHTSKTLLKIPYVKPDVCWVFAIVKLIHCVKR